MKVTNGRGPLWVVLGASLLASGCTTTEERMAEGSLEPLSAKELQALFANGARMRWSDSNGASGTSVFYRDGTAEADWGGGSGEGIYSLDGNRYCDEWQARRVSSRCFSVYALEGDDRYRAVSGNYTATWEVVGEVPP